MRLFSNRSQKTSKCGKNISDTLAYASCATFLFLPHFDVICDLLLNRRTATWNLFVKCYTAGRICTPVTVELFHDLNCLFLVMVRLICQHHEIQALEFPSEQSSSHWSLVIQCLLYVNNTTKVTCTSNH